MQRLFGEEYAPTLYEVPELCAKLTHCFANAFRSGMDHTWQHKAQHLFPAVAVVSELSKTGCEVSLAIVAVEASVVEFAETIRLRTHLPKSCAVGLANTSGERSQGPVIDLRSRHRQSGALKQGFEGRRRAPWPHFFRRPTTGSEDRFKNFLVSVGSLRDWHAVPSHDERAADAIPAMPFTGGDRTDIAAPCNEEAELACGRRQSWPYGSWWKNEPGKLENRKEDDLQGSRGGWRRASRAERDRLPQAARRGASGGEHQRGSQAVPDFSFLLRPPKLAPSR